MRPISELFVRFAAFPLSPVPMSYRQGVPADDTSRRNRWEEPK